MAHCMLSACLELLLDFIDIFRTVHLKPVEDFNLFWRFWVRAQHNEAYSGGHRKHRQHHKYSDTEQDIHSPVQHGFWFSHVVWIFSKRGLTEDYSSIKDFQKYPELALLEKWERFPPFVLAVLVWAVAGWSGTHCRFLREYGASFSRDIYD